MTAYSEAAGLTLISRAVDPDGDPITVRRINGAVVPSWPHQVAISTGVLSVAENGIVTYDDQGTSAGHPASGETVAVASFVFTLWDGTAESAEHVCVIELSGVGNSPPEITAPVNFLFEVI